MIRKLLAGLVLIAAALVFAGGILTRKAPGLLRSALSSALGKDVEIGEILYDFPDSFEVRGFKVRERGRFEGEVSFSAGRVLLRILPAELLQRSVTVDSVVVEGSEVTVWNDRGRFAHALSEAGSQARSAPSPPEPGRPGKAPAISRLEIKELRIEQAKVRWVDYEVEESGFAVDLEGVDALVRDWSFPAGKRAMQYELSGRMIQERGIRPAELRLSGWARQSEGAAEANGKITQVHLPYFRPYYARVTEARIDEGYADATVAFRMRERSAGVNADIQISSLLFGSYEGEGELFGLKAEEILALLKDSSGRLRFQIEAEWPMGGAGAKPSEVIRQAIARSLKATVLSNLGDLARAAIKRYSERTGDTATIPEKKEDRLQETIDKFKDLFDR